MVVPLCTEICVLLLEVRNKRNLRDDLGQSAYPNLVLASRTPRPGEGKWSSIAENLSNSFNNVEGENWNIGGQGRVELSM